MNALRIPLILLAAAALALSGCSGSDSEPSAAEPSAAEPSAAEPSAEGPDFYNDLLIEVPGYEYVDAPSEAQQGLENALTIVDEAFSDGTAQGVLADDGTEVGYLMLFQVRAEMVDVIGADSEQFLRDGLFAAGSTTVFETVEGTLVGSAPGPYGLVHLWMHEGVMSQLIGEDPAASEFVAAYLAQHA